MNILITGGAGFIGSHFIKLLTKKHPDWYVVNLDLLTYAGNVENLAELVPTPNYKFVQGSITDRKLLEHLFSESHFQLIINFAAESHVDRSFYSPELFTETNVVGTQCLMDAAKKEWTLGVDALGVPIYTPEVKFLQISTDEVYGSLKDDGYFTERTPLDPSSPYAASKAAADLLVGSYIKTYQFPAIITRSTNNYGSHQHVEKLIPMTITRALNQELIPVYGDGNQIRDWMHVSDHCKAILTVLHQGNVGQVYNIGSHNECTNLALVKKLLSIVGKPETLIQHTQDRLGHDRRYAIDYTKLETQLGWHPQVTFETGLQETVAWYLEQMKKTPM